MLNDDQILSIVANELTSSSGGDDGDSLNADRQMALASYLGQPNGKEAPGRSKIVSTDVADSIEWIMPDVMKAFTQNNEVVTFDPVSAKDELQADLESQYVYDTLMKDNEGFLILHQFFKDALLQKNGFVKTFYEKKKVISTEQYTGLTAIELDMIIAKDNIELLEQSTEIQTLDGVDYEIHDIKVTITREEPKTVVVAIPPEEFRANRDHNSVSLKDARFTAHVQTVTAGELVAGGLSKEEVDEIKTAEDYSSDNDYRFSMQDESVSSSSSSLDPSMRMIEIAECYMFIDIDEDGIAELTQIKVAGGDNPTLVISTEGVNENPFTSTTAILMSHKLFGLSIYDRLKQIEDQKTTLWRNIFDNMYLQNNQRTVVIENQVNLDDLMVSRPGGIIRAKRADAVIPYVTPPLSSDAYKMMDYLDQVRSSRSGASPEGPASSVSIGDRVGSEGVDRLMSRKEELVGMIIRVFAETGIKDICWKIRNQMIMHQDTAEEYKFRGMWVEVDPSSWPRRKATTVRVGTGSGNRTEQVNAVTQIIAIQEKILANPNQALVTEEQIYKSANDFAKFSGLSGAGTYLIDPASPEGKDERNRKDESSKQAQEENKQKEIKNLEFQAKIAQAEASKAEAANKSVELKAQNEQIKNQLTEQKQGYESQLASLSQRLKEAEAIANAKTTDDALQFKYYEAGLKYSVEGKKIQLQEENAGKEHEDGQQY